MKMLPVATNNSLDGKSCRISCNPFCCLVIVQTCLHFTRNHRCKHTQGRINKLVADINKIVSSNDNKYDVCERMKDKYTAESFLSFSTS